MGAVQPWSQRIVSVVRALGGAPEASVIAQDWRTDVSRAALASGVLIGAFECELLTGSHASGTVLPAALAVSQRERLGGPAFLTLWGGLASEMTFRGWCYPLEAYARAFEDAGFLVETLREPVDPRNGVRQGRRLPWFLMGRCVKPR